VLEFVGRPVASVRLTIDGRDTSELDLTKVVDVRVGAPFAMRDVRESVLHLYALGKFDDVRVEAGPHGGGLPGVDVHFEMTSAKPVNTIQFSGIARAPGIDEGQLRHAVTERAGASPPLTRADELSRVLEATLRPRGYLHAKVMARAVPNGSSHTALLFDLDLGARATIGTITVNGPDDARRELLAILQTSTGAPYERDTLNARIAKYLDDRRSHGYYEARVNLSDESAADERLNLTFTVDPGRHVRVVFSGDPISGERKDLVPVEREGSIDEDLLEDSTARIEDALKAQGFKDAMAPHQRMESGDEVVIAFRITRGQQYRIASASIAGNTAVPASELPLSPRLREGQPFSQAVVDAEAAFIEDVYRRAGYGAAKADVDAKVQAQVSGYVPVAVAFNVREGIRTLVSSITVTGNMAIDTATLLEGLRLQKGLPYVVTNLAADRDAILVKYLNEGYENATIDVRPEPNRDRTSVDVKYSIREGPQVLVDHVLIAGPQRTDPSIVEKQLRLRGGDPLSRDAVLETQRRLQSLGLYRSVSISELRHGEENRRDLLVSVEEGPSRSIAWGGGFELARRVEQSDNSPTAEEVFDAAPRGSFEINWRNLFGTNRSTSVFSSLTLHPRGTAVQQNITEYRVVNTWREPKVFDTPIDGLVTLLLEQQFRSSFNFRRASATAEATRRLPNKISLVGTYQLQQTNVFDVTADQNLIDRVFPNVRLSSFSLSVVRDSRDDQIDPTRGQYFSAYGQLAAKDLGGEVGFFKSFFRASAFHLLPHAHHSVLAGNVFLGLATGFPQQGPNGNTILDPTTGQPARDLPQSERFYAGGDTTMRGFALDQLGVRHIPSEVNDTIDQNGFPLGGNAEMLFNLELRVPLKGNFETHGFLDTGNVYRQVVDIEFGELRSAVGFGVLYKSPIGPLRFDLGFKVNRLPGESLTAFFITFGRAF